MEKLERVLDVLVADEVAPQELLVKLEVEALLQSMPPPVLCVVDGEIMLFMLRAGLDCCCGGAKVGLPMPGLLGAIAGNDEFNAPNVLSGVMVRICVVAAFKVLLAGGGGETGGVDHENVAAGDPLLADLVRLTEGREGSMVDEDADAEAAAHGSPPSISVPLEEPCGPPRTSASKSDSPPPLLASKPFAVLGPPKLMNSFLVVAVALLAPSSCSLRVCSFSTRADVDLIRAMYA